MIAKLINEFLDKDAEVYAWGSYPEDFADAPDCDIMADRFKEFLALRGVESRAICVRVGSDDITDLHWFTVTEDGLGVDFTARQFHNVRGQSLDYDQIPCPLIFLWPGHYPLPGLEMEERGDVPGLHAPVKPTMGGSCVLVYDGFEDGTRWYRCTVHDEMVMGSDVYCEKA